jgi:hypothetical protein
MNWLSVKDWLSNDNNQTILIVIGISLVLAIEQYFNFRKRERERKIAKMTDGSEIKKIFIHAPSEKKLRVKKTEVS